VDRRPKIYFACAISAGRRDAPIYRHIVRQLRCYGTVLTEEFVRPAFTGDAGLTPSEVNGRDLDWLLVSDLLVAEITVPSLGVGYEISKAESWGKPVLCLYRLGHGLASPMITGAKGVFSAPYGAGEQIQTILACYFALRRITPGEG